MQLMHPAAHISTATTFPRRPASVNGASVLNQGPPPMKSGAFDVPTAPPGSAASPTAAATTSTQNRDRTGDHPLRILPIAQASRSLCGYDKAARARLQSRPEGEHLEDPGVEPEYEVEEQRPAHGDEEDAADRLDRPAVPAQRVQRVECGREEGGGGEKRQSESKRVGKQEHPAVDGAWGGRRHRQHRAQHRSHARRPGEPERHPDRERAEDGRRTAGDPYSTLARQPGKPDHPKHREAEDDNDRAPDPGEQEPVAQHEGPEERRGRTEAGEDHRKAEHERDRRQHDAADVFAPLRGVHLRERNAGDEGQIPWDQGHDAGREEPEHSGGKCDGQVQVGHLVSTAWAVPGTSDLPRSYLPARTLMVDTSSRSSWGP